MVYSYGVYAKAFHPMWYITCSVNACSVSVELIQTTIVLRKEVIRFLRYDGHRYHHRWALHKLIMTITWLVFVQFCSSVFCCLYYFSLATQSLLCLAYATKIKMLGDWPQIRNIPNRALALATQNPLSLDKDMAILKGKNPLYSRQTYGPKLPGACDSASTN